MAYLPWEEPEETWGLSDAETSRLLTEAATLVRAGQSSIARAAELSATESARGTHRPSPENYATSRFLPTLEAYLNWSAGGTPTGPPSARPSTSIVEREKASRARFERELLAQQQHAKFEREYAEAQKAWRERHAEAETPASLIEWYRQPEWPYPASEAVGTTHEATPQQPEPPFPNLTPEQGT